MSKARVCVVFVIIKKNCSEIVWSRIELCFIASSIRLKYRPQICGVVPLSSRLDSTWLLSLLFGFSNLYIYDLAGLNGSVSWQEGAWIWGSTIDSWSSTKEIIRRFLYSPKWPHFLVLCVTFFYFQLHFSRNFK